MRCDHVLKLCGRLVTLTHAHNESLQVRVVSNLACERRRISGCRDSRRIFRRRESRQPEIRLRSQAISNFTPARNNGKGRMDWRGL